LCIELVQKYTKNHAQVKLFVIMLGPRHTATTDQYLAKSTTEILLSEHSLRPTNAFAILFAANRIAINNASAHILV